MATGKIASPTPERPLRLWPGVVAVALQWLARFVTPLVLPEAAALGMLGGLAGGLIVLVWWAFFSRAPRAERWVAVALMIVALATAPFILHESMATAGMGVLYFVYAVPVLSLAFVAWAAVSRRLAPGPRWATMVLTILLACLGWALVRTEGVTGGTASVFAWRWAETAEERLLAQAGAEPPTPTPAAIAVTEPDWPGFRGPGRDGDAPGVRIVTDWSASPPAELWRRPVGPGWSSFAVQGGRFYTQEQRGDEEAVTCYDATTGEPVWRHRDAARFWEANAGAGPRATPTLSGGRVYAFGATGLLNALDADAGTVAWSRDVAADTGKKVPYWGFSSSPLVVDDVVIVAAGGQLVAYELASGEPRWFGPDGGESYSSPHLMTTDGVPQVLLLSQAGATSLSPADGSTVWEHAWRGYPIVQPARTADGGFLISVTDKSGLRRLEVEHGPGWWTIDERWTSIRLKPYFNDFVVHRGHAYGFDGGILASIDLRDGERNWKGGRYGHGQLLLLPEQDLLLVVSERGELTLVQATPGRFTELTRFQALEGKTWNHPVLVDDLLLVRNDREMAAFRLGVVP